MNDAEIYELGHKRKPAKVGLFNQEETDADETTAPTAEKSDVEPEPPSDPPNGVAA